MGTRRCGPRSGPTGASRRYSSPRCPARSKTGAAGPEDGEKGVPSVTKICSRLGSCSGYAVLRGEKAPDDALARELDAMGLL